MVLMAMGDHNTAQFILIFYKIGKIGNHRVHSGHISLRERKTAVHHKHIAARFINCNVFADFAQTAQRYDPHRLTARAF